MTFPRVRVHYFLHCVMNGLCSRCRRLRIVHGVVTFLELIRRRVAATRSFALMSGLALDRDACGVDQARTGRLLLSLPADGPPSAALSTARIGTLRARPVTLLAILPRQLVRRRSRSVMPTRSCKRAAIFFGRRDPAKAGISAISSVLLMIRSRSSTIGCSSSAPSHRHVWPTSRHAAGT